MRHHPALPLLALALVLVSPPAAAQDPGAILRAQKVSSLRGGFEGPVHDMDQLGRAIVGMPDLDGDGVRDLAVSAHGSDDGGPDRGAFWFMRMRPNGKVKSAQKVSMLEGGFLGLLENDDEFSRAMARLADLNGDGTVDLAVGATKDDDGGGTRGAVWILFLDEQGLVLGETKISQTAGGFQGVLHDRDQFGRALADLGDLDGDGTRELAVGACFDDDGGSDRGAVWIVSLRPDGEVVRQQKISDLEGGFQSRLRDRDYLGMAAANIGDLDGDGRPELAVGAPGDRDGGGDAGAFYILHLNADGTVASEKKISPGHGGFVGPLKPSDYFGYAIAAIGDVDGNGVTDLAVGAWGVDAPDSDIATNRGAVWILFLRRNGDVIGERKLSAEVPQLASLVRPGNWFGSAVDGVGDLDGDGFYDVAVGSRFDDEGGPGRGSFTTLFLAGAFPDPAFRYDAGGTRQVTFQDRSHGVIESWHWDFGDGTSSDQRNPVHTYPAGGFYRASLTVAGPGGKNAAVASARVMVSREYDPSDAKPNTNPKPVVLGATLDEEVELGTLRPYGSFVNPPNSHVYAGGEPAVGAGVALEVRDPLDTRKPNAHALLLGSLSPDPHAPSGTLLPGFGLRRTGPGELLVGLGPGDVVLRTWIAPADGGGLSFELGLPDVPELVGLHLYLQAALVDLRGGVLHPGLTNGLELVVGP